MYRLPIMKNVQRPNKIQINNVDSETNVSPITLIDLKEVLTPEFNDSQESLKEELQLSTPQTGETSE